MQTKSLSERIAEIKKIAILDPYNLPNSPAEVIAAENRLAIKCLNVIGELQLRIKTLEELSVIDYDANARLSKENQALLAKVKELEGKMEWTKTGLKQIENCIDNQNETHAPIWHAIIDLHKKLGGE